MNKNIIYGLSISVLIHILCLISFKQLSLGHEATFSKNSGKASIKISFRLIETKKKELSAKKGHERKEEKKSQRKQDENLAKDNMSLGKQTKISKYLKSIRKIVEANKYKSRVAKKLRLKGRVKMNFAISRPNKVIGIKVLKRSGHDQLDASALNTINSLKDLPPIPKELNLDQVSIEIGITYQ